MAIDADKVIKKSGEGIGASLRRQYKGAWGRITSVLAVAFAVYILLYVGDIPEMLGFRLFGAHRALAYAVMLLLVFLFIPGSKREDRTKLPWWDILLAVGGAAASFYIFLNWESQVENYATPTSLQLILGGIAIACTLEAARRTLGLALTIIGGFFIVYTLYGNYFPGFLLTKGYSYPRMLGHYYLSGTGMFGSAMEVFAVIVAMYVIFGAFMQASGAGDFFLKLATSLLGQFRGGPAKVAVISSSLFGTVSGLAVANVLTTGSVTIPMMKRIGYKPHFAGAVEATASTGGQLMPPVMGTAAFLMADMLGIPYWGVVMAAIIPAILYYVAVYFQVDFEAAKTGLKGLPKTEIPSFWKTLKEGWQFLLPIFVLIFFIGYLGYSAEKSALYALLGLVAVSYVRKDTRLTPRKIYQTLEAGSHSTAQMGPAAGVIGILMSAVTLTGLGVTLASGLLQASGGSTILLLVLTAVAAIIMGMGASTLLVYVVLAMFVVPAVVKAGVLPIGAHMFVFYFGMISMITPPVALAAYAASALAQSDYWKTGWQATKLGIAAFIVPFLFVYHPSLLLKGTTGEIVEVAITAVIGTIFLAAAVEGWLFTRAKWWERLLMAGGAIMLMTPGWETDVIGLGLIALPLLFQTRVFLARRARAPVQPGLAGGGAASGETALPSDGANSSKGIIS